MKNVMLNKEEINAFKTVYDRIEKAMKERGIESIAELSRMIEEKRGNCPDRSIYPKLKNPPRPEQGYYNLSSESLYVIADMLDVTTDYLLTGTENRPDSSDLSIDSLGLSTKAIKNLRSLKKRASECVDQNAKKSKYYRNAYNKRLDVLNWILEHDDINQQSTSDQMDFLTSLYYYVMTQFEDFRGGVTEVVLNSFDLFEDEHKYVDSLHHIYNLPVQKYQDRTRDEEKKALQQLEDNRIQYVTAQDWNMGRRRIIQEYINNGRVCITDPVTGDNVYIPLGNPKTAIKERMGEILDDWQREYSSIYNKMAKTQNAGPAEREELGVDVRKKDINGKLKYRDPKLYRLTESQMRMYMMLQFLEDNGIEFLHMSDDGKITIADESDINMAEILESAEGTGLYINEEGVLIYDEDKAKDSRERLEQTYLSKILPNYLAGSLLDKENGKYPGYVSEDQIHEYTPGEIENIQTNFSSSGGRFKILDGYLHITYK